MNRAFKKFGREIAYVFSDGIWWECAVTTAAIVAVRYPKVPHAPAPPHASKTKVIAQHLSLGSTTLKEEVNLDAFVRWLVDGSLSDDGYRPGRFRSCPPVDRDLIAVALEAASPRGDVAVVHWNPAPHADPMRIVDPAHGWRVVVAPMGGTYTDSEAPGWSP